MTAGNVAHHGEMFGDEDDMLFLAVNLTIIVLLFWNGVQHSVGANIMC